MIKNQNENKINNFYEKIDNFTTKLFNDNNINIENIYNQSKVIKDYKGIYKYQNEKNVEISIIKLFYSLTNNFPIIQNVLLCNEFTDKSEINSFIYRIKLSEENLLFIIANIVIFNSIFIS